MKSKDYDKKRKDLKNKKREGMKEKFENTLHRKKFVEDIKRSFRAVKRSEKQIIQKEMIDEVWGVDEEHFDSDE
jgi:hypothetical protein